MKPWRMLAIVAACAAAGCMYHVPLSQTLSEAKHAEAVAFEKTARRNGWNGVWDARIHSLDT